MGLGPVGDQFLPVFEEELEEGVLNNAVEDVVEVDGMEGDVHQKGLVYLGFIGSSSCYGCPGFRLRSMLSIMI